MPRYTRQKTRSDCGPVAVLNILKWAGFPVSYQKHAAHLKKVTRYEYSEDYAGCRAPNLLKAINHLGRGKIRARRYRITDLEVLQRHIQKGNAFILRHGVSNDQFTAYHYTAVVPGKDGKFTWLNMGNTRVDITPREFEKRVFSTRRFDDDQPLAIMIRKTDRALP